MVNRRDLFRLFGAGATVVAVEKGVPLLAEPARLILPASVEPATEVPPVSPREGRLRFVLTERGKWPYASLDVDIAEFAITRQPWDEREIGKGDEFNSIMYPHGFPLAPARRITWMASGSADLGVPDAFVIANFAWDRKNGFVNR